MSTPPSPDGFLDDDAIAGHVGAVIQQAFEQNRREHPVGRRAEGDGDVAESLRAGMAFRATPSFPNAA